MVKIQDIRNKVAPSKTKRKISQITKIARHHSATTSGDYFAFWNNRWKDLGWGKGGYHEIILTDGTVQLCYDPIYPTNGIGNHNTNTYHICVVGNGAFTAAQERAFEERCLLAIQNYSLSVDDVLGHNEFSGTATSCPGVNMDSVRKRLEALLAPKQVGGISTDKIMWGKTELKLGQKGKITVLQDINVWEDSPHESGKIIHTRTLEKG
ncbi:N-acetylmuramoyl-L-alanine amidase [Psychrobacillus psychrodurans]|uniref:Autolysin n=1 Tax=Psychrobacillus psychrodurans TaxID=126157 RepID=A0A9X3LCL2_9BACI|nr:peptidoglycan recognition family protein [Psychrobacillus psychrodurans]MCZ8535493.1 N-acetylmuramoyl-L-alanine amidase [Psychrobacillus psychrodurans]